MSVLALDRPVHPGLIMFLARAADLLHQTTTMPDENQFIESTNRFLHLLRESGVQHMLVGGLAMRLYVASRNTEDMDFILAAPDLARLPDLTIIDQSEWFAATRYGPLKVDFLLTRNPFFEEVRRDYSEEHVFQDHKLRCATSTGLVLLKLYALPSLYRQGRIDRADLYEADTTMLLRAFPVEDAALLPILRRHMMESDVKAISEVLADIRKRIARRI